MNGFRLNRTIFSSAHTNSGHSSTNLARRLDLTNSTHRLTKSAHYFINPKPIETHDVVINVAQGQYDE